MELNLTSICSHWSYASIVHNQIMKDVIWWFWYFPTVVYSIKCTVMKLFSFASVQLAFHSLWDDVPVEWDTIYLEMLVYLCLDGDHSLYSHFEDNNGGVSMSLNLVEMVQWSLEGVCYQKAWDLLLSSIFRKCDKDFYENSSDRIGWLIRKSMIWLRVKQGSREVLLNDLKSF